MKVRNTGKTEEKIELQMTPMIDIVFQLLVFFIMTFKIVVPEGDFNIKMPLSAPSQGVPDENQVPPMKVRLTANAEGELTGIRLNDRPMKDFQSLHGQIISILGDDRGPNSIQATAEVELDADYMLEYRYVIEAITSVSGYITPEGNVVKLIEKIKFASPKKKPV